VRDFLYVEDVGDALAALLDSDVAGPVNIGSGVPVSVKDLVMCIAARLGRPDLVRLDVLPTRPDEPTRLVADVRRLTDEVRWRPARDLGEGVDRSIAWWRRRP
jgi:nucleoside-diphosphate-sugar epimerase